MKKLISAMDFLDRTSLNIGKFFSFSIYIIMAIIVLELGLRWIFNEPTEWAHEASSMLYGVYFILGGAYTLIKRDHVRMDIIYARLSLRGKAIADISTFFLFAIYIATIMWFGGKTAWHSLLINEHSQTVWGPPLYPTKIILVIGAILIFIAGCTKLVRNLLVVASGKEGI
jgi:TRAP-type mannitol/chloroaromatic compound transport system permease small subunit